MNTLDNFGKVHINQEKANKLFLLNVYNISFTQIKVN